MDTEKLAGRSEQARAHGIVAARHEREPVRRLEVARDVESQDHLIDRRFADHHHAPGLAAPTCLDGSANHRLARAEIRITKKEGEAVHLVPEGTPGAMIVSVKRVNELDFYSLGLKDLADKAKISQPRALALVKHLNLQSSSEFFKVVQIGGVTFKRYSMKALDELQKALKTVDMEKVWSLNKPTGKPSVVDAATSS